MRTNGWKRVRLGDYGTLRNGVNFDQTQEGLGLPVVKVKDFGDRVIAPLDGYDELDPHKIQIPSDTFLASGDILIMRSNGNPNLVGRSLFFPEVLRPITFSGFCIRFRPDQSRVNPRFISYFIRSPFCRQRFTSYGSGTGIQNLTQETISSLEIDLPPISEQNTIASILGVLDDKIEINRHMNHTLESMAQVLFKSWFVDFDPVVAKSEGRKPYGMNAATAALFPSEFQGIGNDEFEAIPTGWHIESLSDIADYENGLALQKHRPEDDEFLPAIKIRELRQGFADSSSEKASPNIKPSCIIDDGNVIFSWSGSLMIDLWCGGKGALNQHLFKVTSDKYPKWFYYFWTNYHLPNFQNIAEGKATTMGHIQRHHLEAAKVVIPSDAILETANKVMQPMLDQIVKNRVQIRTLATIRNSLLPQLLSGELRVKQAEKVIEDM